MVTWWAVLFLPFAVAGEREAENGTDHRLRLPERRRIKLTWHILLHNNYYSSTLFFGHPLLPHPRDNVATCMYVLYRERNFIKSPTHATQELRLVVSNARLTFYVNQISKNAYSCIIYLPFFHSIKHIHCFFIIIIIIFIGTNQQNFIKHCSK